jgi:uncharacterized GH25 family protein
MRRRFLPARALAASSIIVFAMAGAALAHETWVMPSTFSAKVGDVVRFELSSGMAFPQLESAIKEDRVAKAAYRLGQGKLALGAPKNSETSLVVRQAFSKDGVATVWLDLKPKDIELTDEQVAEYLEEIDATGDIRSTWAEQKGRVAWKETYTKHAKTFVAVGRPAADRSWAVGVGQALELVPSSNPLAVTVGGQFTVALHMSGKPLANVPVGLQVEGVKPHVFRTTDASGLATFPITKDGRAMFFAVRLIPSQDRENWTSDFCTMTFEIHRPQ